MTQKTDELQTFTPENVSAAHVPKRTTDTHPRPSTLDALERGRLRHPLSDRTQRRIWFWSLLGLMLLLALAIAVGLRRS